jgi:hypothetical protein
VRAAANIAVLGALLVSTAASAAGQPDFSGNWER